MLKFYTLVAAMFFASTINAQGSETFENQTILKGDNSYNNGSFAGETGGVTVNFQAARDQSEYAIQGKGLMLRRSDEPSFVEFVIPNGVGTFTYEYRKAFTNASERRLVVQVDGVDLATSVAFGATNGVDATVYTRTVAVNKEGEVKIKITYPAGTPVGNKQAVVDNISWTVPALDVLDLRAAKLKLVKNTNVANELMFGEKADVQILNMNGQVVKSASVNENTRLNVSSLSKGVYIVTGVVKGEKVSQKIIKN